MAFKNTQDPPRVAPTTVDIAPSTGRQYVTEEHLATLGRLTLSPGAALGDADVTIAPGTDKASLYEMPAGTLTTNRVFTLSTANAVTGLVARIIVRDVSVNTATVANGGAIGGNLFVTATPRTKATASDFYFNGSNWVPAGVVYLA